MSAATFIVAQAFDNGGVSGAEAFALLITALATLLTAIGGFVVVFRQANSTERKIDSTRREVDRVYEHVNGIEEEGVTLGAAVREMRADVRAMKREMGIDDKS